ncbi:MAG: hypothetical protein MUF00_02815 [Gemmatimonadaceae bacterium]|jgi:tetratricopeptide (TPR) repeat protein|nr:hypothetical protein [Gemmatimonadaceae bacterium]
MPSRDPTGRLAHALTRAIVATVALVAGVPIVATRAQPPRVSEPARTPVELLFRALAQEDSSRFRDAAQGYRLALDAGTGLDADQQMLAMLGFERVASELGLRDSVLAVIGRVLTRQPRDATAHGIRLRTLRAVGADAPRTREAMAAADSVVRAAFVAWCAAAPRDPAPYREYARMLLEQRRTARADTVLQQGAHVLGGLAGIRTERAQVDALLGHWGPAGREWSTAVREGPWNELAALFSLQGARSAGRDSVRAAIRATRTQTTGDTVVVLSRLLARLELGWGEARGAWMAVESLAPRDSVVDLWRDVAERLEFNESWSMARDAWARTADVSGRTDDLLRLSTAALSAGDAARALSAATTVVQRLQSAPMPTNASDSVGRRAARERSRALPLVVEALARLGQLAAADSVVASAGTLDAIDARAVQRALAVGWLRAGDATRAARAFPALEEDDELRGWHALLGGDLAVARRALARAGSREPVLVAALTIVARTPSLRSEAIGAVVRALSVRDTTAILAACDRAAAQHADAAPALLTLAARTAPAADARARWRDILTRYPTSVDAPEAALELARATAREGDGAAAIPLYEQMILNYPDSALVPLARRELDGLKRATPGPGMRAA